MRRRGKSADKVPAGEPRKAPQLLGRHSVYIVAVIVAVTAAMDKGPKVYKAYQEKRSIPTALNGATLALATLILAVHNARKESVASTEAANPEKIETFHRELANLKRIDLKLKSVTSAKDYQRFEETLNSVTEDGNVEKLSLVVGSKAENLIDEAIDSIEVLAKLAKDL
jgi:hypothetical protein